VWTAPKRVSLLSTVLTNDEYAGHLRDTGMDLQASLYSLCCIHVHIIVFSLFHRYFLEFHVAVSLYQPYKEQFQSHFCYLVFKMSKQTVYSNFICYFCTVTGIYSLMAMPITVGLRRRSTAARWLGFRVLNPPKEWMSDSCECCVWSEVSVTDWALIQRSRAECGVSEYERVCRTLIAVPSSHDVSTEVLRCKRSSAITSSGQNWRML
jgi:hypothetical protein